VDLPTIVSLSPAVAIFMKKAYLEELLVTCTLYFPYFEKIKVGLCDLHAVCVSPLPINFSMAEPIFMKIYVYIMTSEPISTAYFINPSHQSACLYVYPPIVTKQRLCKNPSIVARQRLGKNVTVATNTYANNRRTVGGVVFYAVRVV
jgi:hypothetical protein